MYPPPGGEPGRWTLKIIKGKIPHHPIKVLGLPVSFPTSAEYVKSLAHESHRIGAQISCSYHMSNSFIKIHDSNIRTYSREWQTSLDLYRSYSIAAINLAY
jgi:hypothetical protein